MKFIVPDASVILKWVLRGDEPEREKALSILSGWLDGDYEIVLPSLWFFEAGNIIARREPELAYAILKRLLDFEFPEAELGRPLVKLILEIVRDCHVTFYDAAYHATAIRAKGTFVTADREYFKRAKAKGYVLMLEGFR
ncbi:MAG: type II toxin-antitoxin system VapC family toxin [Deltaproteobacteria bacterium]|nr:type II toxin-antitoxin system VapC family toxin [Deltaproteobacteria bacterium]